MGTTKLQRKIFTMMMCLGMVLGMTIYNIILHDGFTGELFITLIKEVGIVFIVALILDLIIAGPLAKKIVFSIANEDTKKIFIILGISSTMVILMVLLMSIFGAVLTAGFSMDAVIIYPRTVLLNFCCALPLNLLIVSPVVRGVFIKIFPNAK